LGTSVEVTVTYLEQTEPPPGLSPPKPARKIALLRSENPPVHFYRYLYRLIGDPYNWVSRRRMNDDDLKEIIHHPSVYIYVLYVEGVPGGLAEVDARDKSNHELKFFGLSPDFIGCGYGRYFFANVLGLAWSRSPDRVTLETCSLDHPTALSFYQKFGFKVFDRRQGVVKLMEQPPTPH